MILINEMSNCRIVDNLWHPKANEAVSLRACVAACRNTKWHDGTLARFYIQGSDGRSLLSDIFPFFLCYLLFSFYLCSDKYECDELVRATTSFMPSVGCGAM